jgi:hypothetical protein
MLGIKRKNISRLKNEISYDLYLWASKQFFLQNKKNMTIYVFVSFLSYTTYTDLYGILSYFCQFFVIYLIFLMCPFVL